MIAHLELGHSFTNTFHHSRALMAEDNGKLSNGISAVQGGVVCVTNSGGDNFNSNFVGARGTDFYFFDGQRLVQGPGYRCATFDDLRGIGKERWLKESKAFKIFCLFCTFPAVVSMLIGVSAISNCNRTTITVT